MCLPLANDVFPLFVRSFVLSSDEDDSIHKISPSIFSFYLFVIILVLFSFFLFAAISTYIIHIVFSFLWPAIKKTRNYLRKLWSGWNCNATPINKLYWTQSIRITSHRVSGGSEQEAHTASHWVVEQKRSISMRILSIPLIASDRIQLVRFMTTDTLKNWIFFKNVKHLL